MGIRTKQQLTRKQTSWLAQSHTQVFESRHYLLTHRQIQLLLPR